VHAAAAVVSAQLHRLALAAGPFAVSLPGKTDRTLARIAGDGNTIVHGFLRVLTVVVLATLAIGLVAATGLLFRGATPVAPIARASAPNPRQAPPVQDVTRAPDSSENDGGNAETLSQNLARIASAAGSSARDDEGVNAHGQAAGDLLAGRAEADSGVGDGASSTPREGHDGESGIAHSDPPKPASGTGSSAKPQASATSRKAKVGAQFRITEIAGKTPQDVQRLLGRPTVVTPITNDAKDMPGEYRDYKHGRFTVVVQFFRGRAIAASMDIDDPPARTPAEALSFLGLSPSDLTQTFETPKDSPITFRVIRWRGTVDEVQVEDVSATKSGNGGWVLVAVHFQRSLTSTAARASPLMQVERFTVYFKSGKQRAASNYEDEGDTYRITFSTGGMAGYPKSMVERIEPIKSTRTWTDNTGNHHIEAELASVEDGNAVLRQVDGKTTTIPLARLSDADRRFIEVWRAK